MDNAGSSADFPAPVRRFCGSCALRLAGFSLESTLIFSLKFQGMEHRGLLKAALLACLLVVCSGRDLVVNLENAQKMDDPAQREDAREASANLSLDIRRSRSPFSADSGVNDGEIDTEGVFQASKLANLSLKMGEDSLKQNTTRARDLPPKKVVQATSSPVTPLEMPGSPTQPLKKMKSEVVEQIKMARLMLIARDAAPPMGLS